MIRCMWSELLWLGSLIGGRAWCIYDRTHCILSTARSWGPKTQKSWKATSTTWCWILGMRSVELCQEIGIEYVISWDSLSFLGAIPLPVNQIFQFKPTRSETQDLLYGVDRSILQYYRLSSTFLSKGPGCVETGETGEWWGLSRETWNVGWILYCEGSSSSYVTGLTWRIMGKGTMNLTQLFAGKS